MSVAIVIDDEEIITREITESLNEIGIPTTGTTSPEEGIESATEETRVALVDLKMPSMDGLEVARRIQEKSTKVEFIVYSAYGSHESKTRAAAAGIRVRRWLEKDSNEGIDVAVQAVSEEVQQQRFRSETLQIFKDRFHSAADKFGIPQETADEMIRAMNLHSIAVPRGLGRPILPAEPESRADSSPRYFSDILDLITVHLAELEEVYESPAGREYSWSEIQRLILTQLWRAVELLPNEFVKQLAVQFKMAVSKIDSLFLTREHIRAAQMTVAQMKSTRVEKSDVSLCKKSWRSAGVETLPSLSTLMQQLETLYGNESSGSSEDSSTLRDNDTDS